MSVAGGGSGPEAGALAWVGPGRDVTAIKAISDACPGTGNHSMGTICKSRRQAETAYEALQGPGIHLLTEESTSFQEGVIITTAHLSKGLEFDAVIVPFTSARNYQTAVDRSMLYVACTRAMHQLPLTHSGAATSFLAS